ncbi:MAG: hypothetical protein RL766_2203, partial [Bacteroidota bacterium]
KISCLLQFNDIQLHGWPHGRDHLPVHVIEQGNTGEEKDQPPGVADFK